MEDIIYTSVAIIELALIKKDKDFKTNWDGFKLRCGIRSNQEEILITALVMLKDIYSLLKSWNRKENLIEIKINPEKPLPEFSSIQLEEIKKVSLRRCLVFRLYDTYQKTGNKYARYSLMNDAPLLEVSGQDIHKAVDYLQADGLIEYGMKDGGKCTCKLEDYSMTSLDSLEDLFDEFKTIDSEMIEELIEEENMEVNDRIEPDQKKVFVVHGRNKKARDAMFQFLLSIGLQPIEWSQAVKTTKKGTPYVGEVLDVALRIAQAIIILITGDDIAQLREKYIERDDPDYERKLTPQARPNVIFEAGLAFGRSPDRTILVELEKEKTRPFSDIYGRHFVRLTNEAGKRNDLISRLRTAGCDVDIEGKQDWTRTGDFDGTVDKYESKKELEKMESEPLKKDEDFISNIEHINILLCLADAQESVPLERGLFRNYKREFSNKERRDFKFVINELKKNKLIKLSYNFGGDSYYDITSKGLSFLKERIT